ncbi:MAG: hypothetical protein AB2693_22160 [Candidatus Thiodiazotropha sp.]
MKPKPKLVLKTVYFSKQMKLVSVSVKLFSVSRNHETETETGFCTSKTLQVTSFVIFIFVSINSMSVFDLQKPVSVSVSWFLETENSFTETETSNFGNFGSELKLASLCHFLLLFTFRSQTGNQKKISCPTILSFFFQKLFPEYAHQPTNILPVSPNMKVAPLFPMTSYMFRHFTYV